MRRLITIVVLLCITSPSMNAQIEFFNPNSLRYESINLKDQSYSFRVNSIIWKTISHLTFENITPSDLPSKPKSFTSNYKSELLISIEGSGQVYVLNVNNKTFRRIDNTYYRGYNFNAIKFIRNDTLFSFGGLGFWHLNNVESYFNTKSKEWELYESSRHSPSGIDNQYGGYDEMQDKICAIDAPKPYDENGTESLNYYEFHFQKRLWENKGSLNSKLLKNAGLNSLNSTFIAGLFGFRDGPN